MNALNKNIDIDKFIQTRQDEITHLVNKSLNRAGEKIQEKVAAGELSPNMQDVLPLLLYEVLVTNTVATLRLVAEMLNNDNDNGSNGMGH